jgi:pyridoxal phosphate enzyme (YggS family)
MAAAAASSAAASEIRVALTGLQHQISSIVKAKSLQRTPLLVAVSKTKPVEAILHAYNASPLTPLQRHFGENYVQELLEKAQSPELLQDPAHPERVRWHFIGHLQTNKCKQIAKIPNLELVESVDSVKLATELNKACESVNRPSRLNVLIQVNTSGEESKFGCQPSEAVELYGHVLRKCPKLRARGLMTIGRLADTPQPDCFDTLVDIRKQVLEAYKDEKDEGTPAMDALTFEMSMGMSGDFEVALEKGATILRIGSTIFGKREYPQKKEKDESAKQLDKATK